MYTSVQLQIFVRKFNWTLHLELILGTGTSICVNELKFYIIIEYKCKKYTNHTRVFILQISHDNIFSLVNSRERQFN